jgi:phage shock protein E
MILIDVRTSSEYADGHYPNAINHELDLIMQGVFPDVPLDTEIQMYCRSGNRSGIAKQLLEQSGFNNVINIGGYTE